MGRYRIGDFARELGVTPDFLKYCEKNGFLQPEIEENGYRYFDFRQSALAIEYLKMKSLSDKRKKEGRGLGRCCAFIKSCFDIMTG